MPQMVYAVLIAYVLGLALVGYVGILWLLSRMIEGRKLLILKLVHFCGGIGGMVLMPAYFYGQNKRDMDESAVITFGAALMLSMGMSFLVGQSSATKLARLALPSLVNGTSRQRRGSPRTLTARLRRFSGNSRMTWRSGGLSANATGSTYSVAYSWKAVTRACRYHLVLCRP